MTLIPDDTVVLSCKARIGNEQILVQDRVLKIIYDDPDARKLWEERLRRTLVDAILEKWTPVVKVNRG